MTEGNTPAKNKPDKEFWEEYFFAVLLKWNDLEKNSSRVTGLMLLAALIFEFINRGRIHEVNVGFVKLSGVGFLLVIVPVVLAYLYSTFSEIADGADGTSAASESAFRKVFTSEEDGWWREELAPPSSVISGMTEIGLKNASGAKKLSYFGARIRYLLSLAWPIIFEIYAYTQLYRHHSAIPVTLSLVVSVTLISYALVTLPTSTILPLKKQQK